MLYLALTLVAIALFTLYGWTGADPAMNLYQATAHAFSTLSIGGFSTQNDSVASFAPITQWTIVVLLVLAGMNFLRLYRVLVRGQVRAVTPRRRVPPLPRVPGAGATLLLLELLGGDLFGGGAALRNGVFQAVSIMTTAGFATADYTQWGALAELTLLLLMFLGASAGSTGGSIKVIRHLLMFRIIGESSSRRSTVRSSCRCG